MIRIYCSVAVLLVNIIGGIATAGAPPSVLILPLAVYSDADAAGLQQQVTGLMAARLKNEGATVRIYALPGSNEPPFSSLTAMDIKRIGAAESADAVIYGSVSLIGNAVSLDARLIQVGSETPPTNVFAQGNSVEALSEVVDRAAGQLIEKLFQREKVEKVVIQGNQRIETDAILKVVQTKPGNIYSPKDLSQDLKAINKMGYFQDLRVESDPGEKGRIVTFKVTEKPTVRHIILTGNKVFDDDEIQENLTINTGTIINTAKIQSNIDNIELQYKEKNYHNIKVGYKIRPLKNNQADLEFIITEGGKVYIESIVFKGNKAFKDKKLKKMLKTTEKGFFSWLTSSGDLNQEDLKLDASRITAFYQNQGYIQARVAEPAVEIRDGAFHIEFKIEEGPRFKVGKVDITGDLIKKKEQLLAPLAITQKTYYSREAVRNDMLTLTDLYSDEGFAYADVAPVMDRDTEQLTVNITYKINKKQLVDFEKILIAGNTRTRDKVIRRELRVFEQQRFSGKRLKRSVRNLYRLDFFEDIKVDTVKGSADDKMLLKINLTEKATGTFSFGAGYSSVERLFLTGSVSERNLFGRGQVLQLSGQVGSSTTRFTLSFTEPWLFDIPLSATVRAFNTEEDLDEYDLFQMGGGLRLSYPIFDYTRLAGGYEYSVIEVDNVQTTASDQIKELEGSNRKSALTTSLNYDSRDRAFNASRGGKHSLKAEYAGLGGDIGYIKVIGDAGYYYPLTKWLTGYVHGRAGTIWDIPGMLLPDYEKFYLGGINSVRGYDYRDISLTEINSDGELSRIGGDRMVQANVEAIFPIAKDAGVMGVVFFDAGNVYGDKFDLGDLRKSTGGGIRWYSPVGPIRLEYGMIIDPREGDGTGRWEFAMGGAF